MFDVPYEDMVRGARSGSSSGRMMSSGRGFSAASGYGQFTPPPPTVASSGQFTPPPPTVAGSGQFTPSPPTIEGQSVFAPPPFWQVHLRWQRHRMMSVYRRGGDSFYDDTLWEEKCTESLSKFGPDSLEGARTDMDEERLLGRSVQHMGHREMARNLQNNESETGCQSRGQQAYKWENELKRSPTFQEVFDKTHKKKGMDQYISDRTRDVVESYSQQMTEKYVGRSSSHC
ncbi:hypothetical protein Taro_047260 [Colocasia esculenta]|uniref:Uncharacterized protein n=1 Tax=Colocasia esculenta TaxID=4460 RepID=A0A843X7V2_COLES|nr:hypothetical protein [Colocasia esculenta]